MEKHYFSLRHLNINLCDLFISPDVPLQSRLHQLSNSREPQLYFLSARLVNCSFLISKNPSEGDLFSLICSSSKVPKFYPDLKTQNAAACCCSWRTVVFVEPNFSLSSWLPSGENVLYSSTKNFHSLSVICSLWWISCHRKDSMSLCLLCKFVPCVDNAVFYCFFLVSWIELRIHR